jgi:hypothetical protein
MLQLRGRPAVRDPVPGGLAGVDPIVRGYRRHVQPTDDELDWLGDAVRFRPLVVGARSLAEEVRMGRPAVTGDWWRWYERADEVARRARDRFEAETS